MKTDVVQKNRPQIKICGLTDPDEAAQIAELGADAIGVVFYPKSPRNVTKETAADICNALPRHVVGVGVFVNAEFEFIMEVVERTGIKCAQLHGNENPRLVDDLRHEGLSVIKALFAKKEPGFVYAEKYHASAFLLECGKGRLPGGNAEVWNWSEASDFGVNYPLVLAGGLDPENVIEAVNAGMPDAVDISSGVELYPGRKDVRKAASFIESVSKCHSDRKLRRIFNDRS